MAIKNLLTTFWLNRRHFKMQIFGVSVFICVSVFLLNLLSIKVDYDKEVAEILATKVNYTSYFNMSKSNTGVTVNKIFVDSTKTKCFILLAFDNMDNMPADAAYYQMFITNTGKGAKDVKEHITGEIYMFGANGMMGLYLHSDVPFANQPKRLTIRSYKNLTKTSDSNSKSKKYDDGVMVFNPGGQNSKSISFLEYHDDAVDFNYTDIYRQTYAVNDEAVIRQNIQTCYDQMRSDIAKLIEYADRIKTLYNVKRPDLPYYFDGDSFENSDIYDNDGNVVGSYVRFIPKTVVPGGTDFDWYRGNIVSSYYYYVPNTKKKTISQYLQGLTDDKNSRGKVPKVKSKDWVYFDGTPVNLEDNRNMTTAERTVYDAITDYETTLQDYMDLKNKYQTEYLRQLLELELNSDFSYQLYTVNRKDDVLMIY